MTNDTADAKELLSSLDETWNKLAALISSANDAVINKVPFEGSWTIGQLIRHVTKSNTGMVKVLQMEGKDAGRDPAQGAEKMKKIFMDFEAKYQAPKFIIPETKEYNKKSLVHDFEDSVRQLKGEYVKQDLSQMVNVEIFGEVTKLELFYFILYHTQRHIHQLKNILKEL